MSIDDKSEVSGNSSKYRLTRIFLVFFFCIVMVLTVLGFVVRSWMPPVATEHGRSVDQVILYLLVTTGIVFVLGHLALIWMLWKQSESGPSKYLKLSQRTELMWSLVPAVLMVAVSEAGVLVLAQPILHQLYGELPEDAIEIEVVGKQFEWIVRYPGKDGKFGRTQPELVHDTRNPLGLVEDDPSATDDIIKRGELHLPVDIAASIYLRTHDVQHSFAIAEFRVKQDLVPGLRTHVQLVPIKTGEFEIACAELCGLGHYKMKGRAIVESKEEFENWLAGEQGWFEY